AQVGEAVAHEVLGDGPQRLGERPGRPSGEVDEDEAAPGADGDVEERIVAHVEAGGVHLAGGAHQPPVPLVGPAMVGADDPTAAQGPRLVGAEDRAAMATGVVERAELSVLVAEDEDALSADLDDLVVPGVGDLFLAAGYDPHGVPERLEL